MLSISFILQVSKLEKEKQKWENKNSKEVMKLGKEDIAEVISSWTRIPVKKLTQDENESLEYLIADKLAIRPFARCLQIEDLPKLSK